VARTPPACPRSGPSQWPGVPEWRRRIMRANTSKHTKPEKLVRSLLHQMGYRFRLHRRELPGSPDIVLASRKAAIQVYGCFWHQHNGCSLAPVPKTRVEYWLPKLKRNVQRDRAAESALRSAGWRVLVIWECELATPPEQLAERFVEFLGPPGGGSKTTSTYSPEGVPLSAPS
jgi:DNA mismatch endonuclease, patch repair protein